MKLVNVDGLGINDSPSLSTSFCACVNVCLDNITSSRLLSHLLLNSLQEISEREL